MDELHGILIAYEMRKGIPISKGVAFNASKSKKGKEWNTNSDDSDVESELAQFVQILKKGSKLKGKYPLICFKCGRIGHYVAKCPLKHDSDGEENSKRMVYKRKSSIRRISSLSKMSLMKMNLYSSKINQLIISLIAKEVMMNQMKKMTIWKPRSIIHGIHK